MTSSTTTTRSSGRPNSTASTARRKSRSTTMPTRVGLEALTSVTARECSAGEARSTGAATPTGTSMLIPNSPTPTNTGPRNTTRFTIASLAAIRTLTVHRQDSAKTSTRSTQVGRHVFPMSAPRWHLALVLDGSVSLPAEDYAAEIDAMVAGLDDAAAFPRDGRFGISVTVLGRYLDPETGGWVDALMVIPEWAIFSKATMATLQENIRAIPQSTQSGGSDRVGLSVAVSGTESFQSRNALRSVCEVSFNERSSGLRGDLPGSRASASVDRIDLVGIGGQPGGNTGSSMSEYYVEDLLFGGNRYLYAQSTAELADEWVGHCAERFPLIRGMEVNQAIQNLENNVPLVAGRHTVVRVYAEKVFKDDPDWALTGTLSAWDRDEGITRWYGLPPMRKAPLNLGMDFTDQKTRMNLGTNRVLEFRIDPEFAQGDLQACPSTPISRIPIFRWSPPVAPP